MWWKLKSKFVFLVLHCIAKLQNLDLPNGFDRGGGDDDTDSDRTDPWPEDVGEQDEEDIDIHDNTINQ